MICIQLLLRRIVKIFAVVIVIFDIVNINLFTAAVDITLKKVLNLCQHSTYHNTRSVIVLPSANEKFLFVQGKIVFFCVFFFKKKQNRFHLHSSSDLENGAF